MQEYRPYRAPLRLPIYFIILMRLPQEVGRTNSNKCNYLIKNDTLPPELENLRIKRIMIYFAS